MKNEYSVVITTCASDEEAKTIIESLLSKQLVACIQTFNINSFFTWKGSVSNDPEIVLLIKCIKCNYELIENDILSNHKYEVPEIIELPITNGYANYFKWMEDVSK